MLLSNHMGMLTQEDLKQIGGLLTENNKVLKAEIRAEIVPEIVAQVGEMLEQNILPQFDMMNDRFDRMETRLDGVETRLDGVENRLGRVETRLDRVETRLDRVDGKVNALTNVLLQKTIITDADKRAVLS